MQDSVQEHHSNVYQDSYAPAFRGCDSYPGTQPTFEMPAESAMNISLGFVLPPHLQTLDMGYRQAHSVTQSQLLQANPRMQSSYSSYPSNDSIEPFPYSAPNIVAPEWTLTPGFASSLQNNYQQQPFNPSTHPIDSSLPNTVHSDFSADTYYSGNHQVPTRHRDREVPLAYTSQMHTRVEVKTSTSSRSRLPSVRIRARLSGESRSTRAPRDSLRCPPSSHCECECEQY